MLMCLWRVSLGCTSHPMSKLSNKELFCTIEDELRPSKTLLECAALLVYPIAVFVVQASNLHMFGRNMRPCLFRAWMQQPSQTSFGPSS